MNILILAIVTIFERAVGSSIFVLPLLTVLIFDSQKESLPKFSLISGLLIDLFMGHSLGISSILLLISSIEISAYKSKIESGNLWSIFLLGLLVSAQAHILWGTPENLLKYLTHAVMSVIFYILYKNFSRRKGGGIYLRS